MSATELQSSCRRAFVGLVLVLVRGQIRERWRAGETERVHLVRGGEANRSGNGNGNSLLACPHEVGSGFHGLEDWCPPHWKKSSKRHRWEGAFRCACRIRRLKKWLRDVVCAGPDECVWTVPPKLCR